MQINMDEGSALTVMVIAIAASLAAVIITCNSSDNRVKVECHKAQVAAYSAGASAPACPAR